MRTRSGWPRSGRIALWLTLVFVAAFAAREVTRAALADPERHWILRPELLGVAPAVSLLVGTIAFVSARHQFALSQRPLLTYSSGWIAGTDTSRMLFDPPTWVWKVTLRNAGPGTAVVDSVSYAADVLHEGRREQLRGLTGDALLAALSRYGYEEDRDLSVALVSPGGALEPRADARLCELPSDVRDWLAALDIDITYRSLLGDKFTKTVHCVPKRGLPKTPEGTPGQVGRRAAAVDGQPTVGLAEEPRTADAQGTEGLASRTD